MGIIEKVSSTSWKLSLRIFAYNEEISQEAAYINEKWLTGTCHDKLMGGA